MIRFGIKKASRSAVAAGRAVSGVVVVANVRQVINSADKEAPSRPSAGARRAWTLASPRNDHHVNIGRV